jgi:hypothetical protein
MNLSSQLILYSSLTALGALSNASLADNSLSQSEFEKRLYQPAAVSTLGIGTDRYRALSTTSKKDLLDARVVVDRFFQALERGDGKPSQYLVQAQSSKSREEIRKSLVADETTILQVGVSDFKFDEAGKRLNLSIYLLLFSEGTLVANEAVAVLEKRSGVWRILQVTKSR